MSVIKVACPECGQRVSGDETFFGKTVPCPLCSTEIVFPREGEPVPPLPERPAPAAGGDGKETAPKPEREEKSSAPAKERSAEAPAPKKKEAAAERKPAKRAPAVQATRAPVASGSSSLPAAAATAAATAAKEPPPNSGAALWSMVFGIAAFALCPIGLLLAIPAIFCGHAGRGNVQRSLGKLGGMGMANAGMLLGYAYVAILGGLVVFGPRHVIGSHLAQGYNNQTATAIVQALQSYAEDNGGKFPGDLEDIVPDYMLAAEFEASQWIDPGSVPFLKRTPFLYAPGHSTEEEPKTILLYAPDTDGAYRRLVAYLDGSVEILPEEEFIRRTGNP